MARYLREQGVGPEVRVGICVDRSLELVIALLGVLKAGGAYVPLDPGYPRERLEWMVEDADTRLILTRREEAEKAGLEVGRCVYVDEVERELGGEAGEEISSGLREENLAYVIYTSGSTGRPKGVMVRQPSLWNVCTSV